MTGYMYILKCADGSYYVGSTNNLELRLAQHQAGEGANHTKKRLPVELVYFEEFQRIDEAFYREKQVQGWNRKKKEALIKGDDDQLPELAIAYRDIKMAMGISRASIPVVLLPEALEGNAKEALLPEGISRASMPVVLLPEALEGNAMEALLPEGISRASMPVVPLPEVLEGNAMEALEGSNCLGNTDLLYIPKTAFLCSRKVPASVVLKCYDWAVEQREKGNCVISGFHSQLEKDVLHYLLKGKQPIVLVLARGLKERIEPQFKKPLEQGRLFIISPFDKSVKRVTEATARTRNQLMISIANDITVGYASAGGQLEKILQHADKPISRIL